MSIQVCLISWMTIYYMKNGGKKSFLANQSINIVYSNKENMIVRPITRTVEIIMSIQVYLISKMTINYKENGEKKSIYSKSKASISCILMWTT